MKAKTIIMRYLPIILGMIASVAVSLYTVSGSAGVETAIGSMPHVADININGLDTDPDTLAALLEVDTEAWLDETEQIREYLEEYGDRLPQQLLEELDQVTADLKVSL